MVNNLTKGNPFKLVLLFSIPLVIGNMFQQFYNMADTLIVGRTLGYQALAAVGATGGFVFLITGFVQGYTAGFTIPVAQQFGAGNLEEMRRNVGSAILLSIVLTALITVLSVLFARPILELLQTPEDIIDGSYAYVVVIFGGIAATVFYNLISNILRALGDSRTPTVFLILASLINIVLDLLFIVKFGAYTEGAAWATVISQAVSGLLCLVVVVKKFPILHLKLSDFELKWKRISCLLSLGMPMAFQFSITAIGALILQAVLNGFGSEIIAGSTSAAKVEQVTVMASFNAIGMAMATYSAQNFGAGELKRVRSGALAGMAISCGIVAIGMVICIGFGRQISALFMEEPTEQILDSAQLYLNVMSVFYLALAAILVFRNVLQGIGKGLVPLLSGIVELMMRAVCALVLAPILGYFGACLAGPLAWFAAGILLVLTYLWHSRRLLKDNPAEGKAADAEKAVTSQ